MKRHYIIGAGGIGCWLAPLLKKMAGEDRIIVMDGDRIEKRNFDRQLHNPEHLGWNKAEALYFQWELKDFIPRYLSKLTRPPASKEDWVWCCVDNHPARVECLDWIDAVDMHGVFGGNEYRSCQAWFYSLACAGTSSDPRVRYPELLTDKTGDPIHPNCQGEAQVAVPQLALFNYLAAGQMVHLYQCWLQSQNEISPAYLSIEHQANSARFDTFLALDYERIYPVPEPGPELQDIEME